MIPRVLETEWMDTSAEASDYDSMDHTEVNARFVADLLAFQRLAPGDTVLDLGTGTALIPIELCRANSDVIIHAVDAAESMLTLARENVRRAGHERRIELARVDAKRLPYPSGRFEGIMSNSIIHHIPEPFAVLQEAARVTAPGGWLFFRDLMRPDSQAALAAIVDRHAGGPLESQRKMFADSLHAALTLEEIRGLAGKLGFPPDAVTDTSDRHWTFAAIAPPR